MLGVFVKDCNPWEGPHWSTSFRTASCGRDSTLEPGEEGATKTACGKLTTAPISHPPVPLCLRKSGLKLILGRMEGWEKGVLRFVLISPFPTDLVGNKLN